MTGVRLHPARVLNSPPIDTETLLEFAEMCLGELPSVVYRQCGRVKYEKRYIRERTYEEGTRMRKYAVPGGFNVLLSIPKYTEYVHVEVLP